MICTKCGLISHGITGECPECGGSMVEEEVPTLMEAEEPKKTPVKGKK